MSSTVPAAALHATQVFPSLQISADGFVPQGAFALAQAQYLEPDAAAVGELREKLLALDAGVVAHFYMDAELQGVLAALGTPRVHIADSLMMADRAVAMAQDGAKMIFVLGVDFMSENVRATLDASGFADVPVYRVAERDIGCSLAEAAEAPAYGAYLEQAARTPRSLHVIYVNTSLHVKGQAERLVPTITCTSSNVLPLVLEAFATVPDLHVWFGPDTYMGHNLARMLHAYAELPADAVARLHKGHTPSSLRSASRRFHAFGQGACIVHHMFGDAVVERVRREYADAFITAHLEVPGEMFELGFAAQAAGRGVVGSTSNILDFIVGAVRRAGEQAGRHAQRDPGKPLRFVLGTESGMATAVAQKTRAVLQEIARAGGPELVAEIVFPVASEAIATTHDSDLPVIPGVMAGEGCSTAGGCASCPYMKMSSLDALMDALDRGLSGQSMASFAPKRLLDSRLTALATDTITRMRELQRTGRLPAELVARLSAS